MAKRKYPQDQSLVKQRLADNISAGKCRCGREKLEGFTRCAACVNDARKANQKRNKERRDAGLCQLCGKIPEPGKSKCEPCRLTGINYLRRLKSRVITEYGGKCICCGESEPLFLTIDHINGNGNVQRKNSKTRRIYNWLEKHRYPKNEYRLLCYNCNCGRQINNGVCPHQIVEM